MITFEKVLILKNIVLFEKASELALSDLIQAGVEQTLKKGEVLLKKDQNNSDLYIVLAGELALKNHETTISIGPRQILGETTVFAPAPEGLVTATEQTVVLKLSADGLYNIMALHPSLAFTFLENLSHQLRISRKNS